LSALAPAERQKLSRILALLDSDQVGERDAAVLAATRLLQRHRMRWSELLTIPPTQVREPLYSTWRKTCARLMEQPGRLRPWERSFVADLPRFPRISTKQRYVLCEIADRVLGSGRS
jgi:hypothetical protein